jgi:hypothetical protein
MRWRRPTPSPSSTSKRSAKANHVPMRPGSSSSGQIASGGAARVREAETSITLDIVSEREQFCQ